METHFERIRRLDIVLGVEISFVRPLARGRYHAIALRDDGVTLRVNGGSYHRLHRLLPHDLAHYIVERELRLPWGFWGVVAAGGLFPAATVVAGRQRPHAKQRATEVVKHAAAHLTQAEVMVSRIVAITASNRESDWDHVRRTLPTRWTPETLDPGQVRRAAGGLREAANRWADAKPGERLAVTWDVPAPARLPSRFAV